MISKLVKRQAHDFISKLLYFYRLAFYKWFSCMARKKLCLQGLLLLFGKQSRESYISICKEFQSSLCFTFNNKSNSYQILFGEKNEPDCKLVCNPCHQKAKPLLQLVGHEPCTVLDTKIGEGRWMGRCLYLRFLQLQISLTSSVSTREID